MMCLLWDKTAKHLLFPDTACTCLHRLSKTEGSSKLTFRADQIWTSSKTSKSVTLTQLLQTAFLPHGKLDQAASKWFLYSPVSSSWKRSLKSNQDKHCKYCAISSHSCLQKKFLSPYQTLHFWKNSCCIFISVYSKMKEITYERTVNLTTVNKCKDNKINILLTKIICVKVLLFINPLPHAAYVEYLLKSCQLYVLHSLLCFCNR